MRLQSGQRTKCPDERHGIGAPVLYLTGTGRLVCEEEEQLSWSDQPEFSSGDLLHRPGILSKSVRPPSESLVLETEPAEIVGEHPVPLTCL